MPYYEIVHYVKEFFYTEANSREQALELMGDGLHVANIQLIKETVKVVKEDK